jgi:N-methylhydantoinase A
VCYGKGGTHPTVTDAAVVLGWVPADNFWNGKIKLQVDDAQDALALIARGLDMSVVQAAEAVMTTVSSNMADGISEISTRRGFDIREFTLLAIGGGGGLCGAALVDLLGIKEAIVPKFSSSFSAWSMFALDVGRDYLRSYISTIQNADTEKINLLFDEMIREAWHEFKVLNVSREEIIVEKSADVRYAGQYHEIEMALPSGQILSGDMAAVGQAFHNKHKELFSFSLDWVPAEMRNLRLTAKVRGTKKELPRIEKGTPDPSRALKRRRACFFDGRQRDTAIYDGAGLKAANVLYGPSIIEEPTTTVVIPFGFECIVDDFGNYIIRKV